jgi:hypothetical protein
MIDWERFRQQGENMSDMHGAAATTEHDELWYVQFAADDVRTMTLEQLDEAFQEGDISAQTFVCQVGSSKWETLADVAGLEDEEAVEEAPVSDSEPVVSGTVSMLPAHAPQYPGVATTGVHAVQVANPFLSPSNIPEPFALPSHFNALSTAPVATEIGDMDVDVDVAPNEFRSRKGRTVVWLGALASIAAIAVGVVRSRKPATVELPPMPPGAALQPEPQVDLVAAALAAAPPVVAAPAVPVAAAAADGRLADDTKKALAEADKSLATKQKAKQKARQETRASAPARTRTRTKTDQPFHKGGDSHDPLNSSL